MTRLRRAAVAALLAAAVVASVAVYLCVLYALARAGGEW